MRAGTRAEDPDVVVEPFFVLDSRGVATTCPNRAGTSRKWDFDGNVELGVVGLHVLPVLVSELLKDLADLRLIRDQCGARGKRLPFGGQADGRCLAQVFVPVSI